jgi:2-oxoglutarate dehydrogenase E2 component (dihydrolipoamide succinyltransferase)
MPHTVHEAGVNRAVELAVDLKAKADSAAPKGAMQRAPGPPPVPGMQPAPGAAAPAPSAAAPSTPAPAGSQPKAPPPGAKQP